MNLKEILKYRNVWMGIAMIWVVLYHAGFQFPRILAAATSIGYGGVDIFLFASGVGCFYSLSKDEDSFRFIKRRIDRLIPTYWCFLVPWTIYKVVAGEISVQGIIGNFLCIQNFTGKGNDFNWYISAIWMLYILAPFFYGFVNRLNNIRKAIGAIGLLILFTVPFLYVDTYIITVTRIPVFFIGMYFARRAEKGTKLNGRNLIIVNIGLLLGLAILGTAMLTLKNNLWSLGLWWYPFILIAPCLCINISYVMEWISNKKWGNLIRKGLDFVGKYSFEVFLTHIFIFELYEKYFSIKAGVINQNISWFVVTLLILPCCTILVFVRKKVEKIVLL